MNAVFEKRLLVVWLGLSAITMVSLWIGSHQGRPSAVATSGAIGIALVKVRIIFREFMEVRHAPALLCRLADVWVVITGASLLGAYLVGMGLSAG